jgi:hypothetical protein
VSDAGRRLENDAGGRRMRDAGVRLGFLYPGGGAEQDCYRLLATAPSEMLR